MRKRQDARLTLIKTRIFPHVSVNEILEFESEIARIVDCEIVPGLPQPPFLKVSARLLHRVAPLIEALWRGRHAHSCRKNYLCIGYLAPHYLSYKTFPYFSIYRGVRMIWLYDAWPDLWGSIEHVLRQRRIGLAFFSSRDAAEHFRTRRDRSFAVHWVPEAVTVANYRSKPVRERDIDVLQIGRRWGEFHDRIEGFCAEQGLKYLYEKKSGDLVFPTEASFVDGLARAKISICVPRNITHPEAAGGLSTMTWRYLQSMASGCLVLGRAPDELRQLFDYEPMVEIDMADPCRQLRYLLDNYGDCQPLIEKNIDYVRRHHQWENRIQSIVHALDDFHVRGVDIG